MDHQPNFQKLLSIVRPQFDELARQFCSSPLNVTLVDRTHELSDTEAIKLCPQSLRPMDKPPGHVSGACLWLCETLPYTVQLVEEPNPVQKVAEPDPLQQGEDVKVPPDAPARLYWFNSIRSTDYQTINLMYENFRRLASQAGGCIGYWAERFGVSDATIAVAHPAARWSLSILDVARNQKIPLDSQMGHLYGQEISDLTYQLDCDSLGAEEKATISRQILRLVQQGYYLRIPDAFTASVYAIDLLCHSIADSGLSRVGLQPSDLNAKELDSNAPVPYAKLKRSTMKGEAQIKLIAALTLHHQYAQGSCLNMEPVGVNILARSAGVSTSTASLFFVKQFKGRENYLRQCNDKGKLIMALQMLNGEVTPAVLSTPFAE